MLMVEWEDLITIQFDDKTLKYLINYDGSMDGE